MAGRGGAGRGGAGAGRGGAGGRGGEGGSCHSTSLLILWSWVRVPRPKVGIIVF